MRMIGLVEENLAGVLQEHGLLGLPASMRTLEEPRLWALPRHL